jgi:hypothetical protein
MMNKERMQRNISHFLHNSHVVVCNQYIVNDGNKLIEEFDRLENPYYENRNGRSFQSQSFLVAMQVPFCDDRLEEEISMRSKYSQWYNMMRTTVHYKIVEGYRFCVFVKIGADITKIPHISVIELLVQRGLDEYRDNGKYQQDIDFVCNAVEHADQARTDEARRTHTRMIADNAAYNGPDTPETRALERGRNLYASVPWSLAQTREDEPLWNWLKGRYAEAGDILPVWDGVPLPTWDERLLLNPELAKFDPF